MVRPEPAIGSSESRRLLRTAVLCGIGFCLAGSPAATGCRGKQATAILPSRHVGAVEIRVECAATEEQRNRGLMFRSRLGDDEGMLFVFREESTPSFWMKNTFVALDLLFLDKDGRVVDLAEGLRPCTGDPCPVYSPSARSRYALEVASGTARRHGISRGDRIELRLPPGTGCAPP